MKEIILPRKDEEGNYYISYSQFTSWKSPQSFNLGVRGHIEYMVSYFFGEKFPDAGWALFGQHVENYVTERKDGEFFFPYEKELMDQIKPLGVFQHEVKFFLFDNVYLLGYIDDATADFSKIRDYKTASRNSKAKYSKPDYFQLDLYGMYVKQLTGKFPEAEVCIIERLGNVMGKIDARKDLKVGKEIWYIQRELSDFRSEQVRKDLLETIHEISEYYKLFLRLQELS
jgi:hypothetical protein